MMRTKDALENSAEYIVDDFLLSFRASFVTTPQVTPTALSLSEMPMQVGTKQRVSILRQACLACDHHRCMISRKFDIIEARKHLQENGDNSKDDDGSLLSIELWVGF